MIRAMKGHLDLDSEFKYKEGDGPAFVLHAETTDKILLFAENGRFYTLAADKLPKGRGFGEPVSLMVDLPADVEIVRLMAKLKASSFLWLPAPVTGCAFKPMQPWRRPEQANRFLIFLAVIMLWRVAR